MIAQLAMATCTTNRFKVVYDWFCDGVDTYAGDWIQSTGGHGKLYSFPVSYVFN